MSSYQLEYSPRFINVESFDNPIMRIFIDTFNSNSANFPLGNYTITLMPIAPSNINSKVFNQTVSTTTNMIEVGQITWQLNERGYYQIQIQGPLNNTFNFINNKFYVYSYGSDDNSYDVAILPETIDIEPDIPTNIQFTLYRLDINQFTNNTYTLTLSDNTNTFSGSTSSSGNPIYITVQNILLDDPNELFQFNATLIASDCNYEIINSPIEIQTLCFIEGTKILTETNGYIPIEKLEPGMLIKTFGSESFIPLKYLYKTKMTYKKTNKKLNKLYKYDKHKFGLIEDLIISGGHSILVNELTDDEKKLTNQFWKDYEKIDNKYKLLACIDSRNNEFEIEGQYNMYQLILESDDANKQYAIDANGLMTETMSVTFYTQHIKKNKLE